MARELDSLVRHLDLLGLSWRLHLLGSLSLGGVGFLLPAKIGDVPVKHCSLLLRESSSIVCALVLEKGRSKSLDVDAVRIESTHLLDIQVQNFKAT